MKNGKRGYVISIFIMMFLLTLTVVGAQDTSKVGISSGDRWEFKVAKNTVTDDSGNIDVFEISESEGGEVAVGDTFEFEISSDVASDGSYEFTYDNGDVRAVGDGDLSEFGSDAVFTDWDYWKTDAKNSGLFDGMDVTVTDGDELFSAVGEINLFGTIMKLEASYHKSTGIMDFISLKFSQDDVTEELLLENVTGATASSIPGFGMYAALLSLVAMIPLVSSRRRN
ncbi:MAG: hypothetical protein INQ03_13490 [Candidatus Heimdallarchaeota archaeon]|nr:hypothetical protein [Candidatus Heimdallarchaeota archaeon]